MKPTLPPPFGYLEPTGMSPAFHFLKRLDEKGMGVYSNDQMLAYGDARAAAALEEAAPAAPANVPLTNEDMADCGLLSELQLEEERHAEWHAEMRRDAFGDKA